MVTVRTIPRTGWEASEELRAAIWVVWVPTVVESVPTVVLSVERPEVLVAMLVMAPESDVLRLDRLVPKSVKFWFTLLKASRSLSPVPSLPAVPILIGVVAIRCGPRRG